ncbi:MAG TPA: copper-containing nitrite reductase [Anaerolineales bacterium]|nr:copper-containing nitrite reductase [Anaerolineales bacterium]
MELFLSLWQYIGEGFGLFLVFACAAVVIFLMIRRFHSRRVNAAIGAMLAGAALAVFIPNGVPNQLAIPLSLRTFGPGNAPTLPISNVMHFFQKFDEFERVADIAKDPADMPATVTYAEDGVVEIEMTTKEVIAEMADGITFNYWTYDGTVAGPFLRVREGDTVRLTLHNDPTSLHPHNIDLHAVTGPGGGGAATIVEPGESKTITFKALNVGLFVYHCAYESAASHMTHGMYGLILVEPKEGLPPVDKEFYVMQGEFYSDGALGREGLQLFDAHAMLNGTPQYIVFNGRTGALSDGMDVEVGETVRLYVGNGGVNLVSNFHVIGEIFDKVYREGDLITPPAQGLQTTLIPAGGAAVVEFTADYPGNYVLVDHALSRLDRGAWGVMHVEGEADPSIFEGEIESGGGH